VYLRFIGNRSIDEKDFGRIQKDRLKELRLDSVSKVKDKARFAVVVGQACPISHTLVETTNENTNYVAM
jgi:hypothetical protein